MLMCLYIAIEALPIGRDFDHELNPLFIRLLKMQSFMTEKLTVLLLKTVIKSIIKKNSENIKILLLSLIIMRRHKFDGESLVTFEPLVNVLISCLNAIL